ncbi:MAG: hypothetical protein J0I21_16560 [Alphaproteobacteria bacterium]|nr:hypothetical protein [Alphaproteobacteria bacterium]
MLGRLAIVIEDIAALRANWCSVRGGWRAAWQDAHELIEHRRLRIDTRAMTPDGLQIVMRTRLRLTGDTQTDILRGWLAGSTPETVGALAEVHFRSVAAASAGWTALFAMQRMLTRLLGSVGAAWFGIAGAERMFTAHPGQIIHAVLTDPYLLPGAGVFALGVPIRWALRRWLRAIFRRGLGPAATG